MTLSSTAVKAEAARLEFVACGVTGLDPIAHADALDRWLKSGRAGTMRYLHRQARKRKNPALVSPRARRAVVVLDNYFHPEGQTTSAGDPSASTPLHAAPRLGPLEPHPATRETDGSAAPRRPRIARYARGRDYHQVTLSRLDQLSRFLRQHGAEVASPFVDTGPIAERELAQRAGLGWIGKNTMVLRPGLGSWFFIGVILTDLDLELDPPFETDHCGSCTRCLDACPTNAFPGPYELDATRCISYLTIEYKGPIPDDLADRLSGWAFGCDICNEVCPWNERFARETTVPGFLPRPELANAGPGHFDQFDESEFARTFGDTALARPGLAGMRRNWQAAWKSLR